MRASFRAWVPRLGENWGIPCPSRKILYVGSEEVEDGSMLMGVLGKRTRLFGGGKWTSLLKATGDRNIEALLNGVQDAIDTWLHERG